jgi:poly-gamma-glutamate capsule biosynthesis protein CapA/YwtB (metallophosphatase superfamily)
MRLALAGDAMLGRMVARRLRKAGSDSLFAAEVGEAVRTADLAIANLECCISERGTPAPERVFHFRAPPIAAETLAQLGVDCVTLANNHALDYGPDALADTLAHLEAAGIRCVGAGANEAQARAPVTLRANGERIRVVGFSDHPAEYAAGSEKPGIAFADTWRRTLPDWLMEATQGYAEQAVLVCAHWGPNMTPHPVREVRKAAEALERAGATLVAGHSAHVFHGVAGRVLYDLGDFIDDYRIDPILRNDLGLLWFVELRANEIVRVEALPLKLDYCRTRLARGSERAWIERQLRAACADFGTSIEARDDLLVVEPYPQSSR